MTHFDGTNRDNLAHKDPFRPMLQPANGPADTLATLPPHRRHTASSEHMSWLHLLGKPLYSASTRHLPPEPNTMKAVLAILLLLAISGCATVPTAAPERHDWPEPTSIAPHTLRASSFRAPGWYGELDSDSHIPNAEVGIFEVGFRFYSRHLTRVDGPRCQHRPSCAAYSYQAVRKHGAFPGIFLGVDRLMRGNRSSVLRQLPIHKVEDRRIYYEDPIEANDFFL